MSKILFQLLNFGPILTAYQLLRAVKLSKFFFNFLDLLEGYISKCVLNWNSLGCVLDTFPVGWLVGRMAG